MQLTENFSSLEFMCRCNRPQCDGGKMNPEFMKKLQAVRDAFGKTMVISSGFRCAEQNVAEKGSLNSMHMKGRAADIACASGSDKIKLLLLGVTAGMNGVGVGKTFLHLDDREEQTIWTY